MPQAVPPIHILVIDNDFVETAAIKSCLEQDMRVPWRVTHCVGVQEARLRVNTADLVLLKPEMEGLSSPKEVFKDIDDMVFELPIIVLTSEDDGRGLSTYVMEHGAADIVIRGHFSRLVDAIEFALIRQKLKTDARKTADKALSDSEDKGKADLRTSHDENIAGEERHRQILRLFGCDYSVDQQDKTNT